MLRNCLGIVESMLGELQRHGVESMLSELQLGSMSQLGMVWGPC